MSTATFSFEEIGHRYTTEDGAVVPSVSQCMELSGISDVSGIPAHILERASAIGTAVHQACEFLDQDDLELDSLDPSIVGYVVGYQKFREEHEFIPELVEHRIVAELGGMRYGMCVDRVGRFKVSKNTILLDIKTSSKPQPSWGIQTAAYAAGLGLDCERKVVHVAKDGTYRLIHHREDDLTTWAAALQVAHWRLAHGAKIK